MTPYCLCHSPSSTAQFKVEFSGTAPGQQSPVRGNGTPRVRFGAGLFPQQSCSPVGTGALTFLQVLLLSSQCSTACSHSTLGCKQCYFFFLSWTLCVPRECAQVCLCPQWDCKKQTLCCKIKSCHHLGSSAVLS